MRWVLALLMVAALARAAPMQVEKAPVDLLHAERVDITDRFRVVRMELAPNALNVRASAEVEMNELLAPAHTQLRQGDYAYTVVLRERAPDGVSAGVFDVRLEAGGRPVGVVRLVQELNNPLVEEGASVTFSIGPKIPSALLFVISVREIPQGPVFALTSAVNTTFDYVWRDGSQTENPTIAFDLGLPATFVVTNGDGTSPHNLQILDGSNPPPTSPNVNDLGDEETLTWTPPHAGAFVYQCEYHSTMKGWIEVNG